MDSITLYTEEIDDLNEAAAELFAQAEAFKFKKNTMAILFMDEDTDWHELYPLLASRWKFPIMGCTGMAMFQGDRGYCDIGVSMLLLTADDCEFSVGITGGLDGGNYREEIAATYRRLSAALPDKERLVISYGGVATSELNIGGDDLVNAINELCRDVPLYGGTAADRFSFGNTKVFYNDVCLINAQVMALVSGNIHPRFVCANSVVEKSSFSYDVTEASGNQVFRMGNCSFIDMLKKENMEADKTDVMADYLLSPFVVTVTKENGDCVEVARTLSFLDKEKGSGNFLGAVPEGSRLSIGIVSRSDVQKSVSRAMDAMLGQLEGAKTLLCTSCCARFLALANDTTLEADTLRDKLPADVSLLGFYSFGEYCPSSGNVTGKEYNMFHNFTFTILAF